MSRTIAVGAMAMALALAPAARAVTWSPPEPITPQTATSGLALQLDGAGDAVVAWTSTSGVFTAIAPPGQTFGSPQQLSTHAIAGSEPSALLAVDPRGDALVAWIQPSPSGATPLYASYRPAGGTFGPDRRVAASAGEVGLGLDGAGDATLVFDDVRRDHSIVAVTRYASGHYGRAQRLSGPRSGEPSVAVNAAGEAVAAWSVGTTAPRGIQYATRTRGGGAFSRTVTIVRAKPGGDEPAVGLDGAGRGLLGWEGPYRTAGNGSAYRGVQTAPVRVGGAARGPISAVSAPGEGGLRNVGEMPEVAVDPGGDIALQWQTYRPGRGGQDGVEVSRGHVGGRLPAATTVHVGVLDEGAQLALGPGGQAIVAWDDLFGPDGASVAGGPRARFGPAQTISSASEEAGLPVVAIGDAGALAAWQDMGPADPSGAPAATPLLYARAG